MSTNRKADAMGTKSSQAYKAWRKRHDAGKAPSRRREVARLRRRGR